MSTYTAAHLTRSLSLSLHLKPSCISSISPPPPLRALPSLFSLILLPSTLPHRLHLTLSLPSVSFFLLPCCHLALRPMIERPITAPTQSALLFIHSFISIFPPLLISFLLLSLSAFMDMMTNVERKEMCSAGAKASTSALLFLGSKCLTSTDTADQSACTEKKLA